MADELCGLLLVELPFLLHVLVQLPVKCWLQNQVYILVIREYAPQLDNVVAGEVHLDGHLADELVESAVLLQDRLFRNHFQSADYSAVPVLAQEHVAVFPFTELLNCDEVVSFWVGDRGACIRVLGLCVEVVCLGAGLRRFY